ncbi:protein disulfide isomerase pTAC5, chloroplastic [Ricinus communis]|uniref:protein disulfide isomerase pTAC5, chloroplastic n=1 Tax=Ricinus communis TaxID=3988 RepID=UPI00201A485E|nr:protein disulfide isomerase pTAC5, chloroplastic [Ricinus communis]
MYCSIPLPLNPPPVSLRRYKHYLPFSLSFSKSHLCFSSSLPNTPSPSDSKDFLWLREEQRWLREEQRWLREEQRWLRERESLLHEIQSLKLQIKALEQRISVQEVDLVPENIASVRALLQVLNEKNRIAESGSTSSSNPDPNPIAVEEKVEEVKEVIGVLKKEEKRRITLRKGSEGDEVREMQEALLNLGFYSGEEDMEFSSFSSGTERAVKTWQASLGAPEDGIMTAELLERLYVGQQNKVTGSTISIDQKESSLTVSQKESANGAAVASITEISETQQKIVKDGVTEVKGSQQRVFLLGENRWEEPSRLVSKDKQVGVSKPKDSMTKCLSCRGEGRLLCTECDGTGEPNIEPQFLEWVGEGMKCPYCEGLGYTTCDVCEGKTLI